LEPIAESADALRQLSATGEGDVVEEIGRRAGAIVDAVPECVAISLTLVDDDLTFTFLATSEDARVIDAAQYVDGGPCVEAVEQGEQVDVEDLMNEDRWQLMAQASAAHGVMSSLSLPLRHDGAVIGSVNMYGATIDAFAGKAGELAQMFGAAVEEAVANFDTSMQSRQRALQTPRRLRAQRVISQAVGIIAVRKQITVEDAHRNLLEAADRAGLEVAALAGLISNSIPSR
jgi:GAF domain-containing protein